MGGKKFPAPGQKVDKKQKEQLAERCHRYLRFGRAGDRIMAKKVIRSRQSDQLGRVNILGKTHLHFGITSFMMVFSGLGILLFGEVPHVIKNTCEVV